jgi:hypothetical protein
MLRRVALVRSDVSEELGASIIKMFMIMEALHSSETSVVIRATLCNIPEDGILHSYSRENLKSYRCSLFTYLSMGWSRTKVTFTAATYWPMVPVLDYGAVSGIYEWLEETEVLGRNLPQCGSVHHRSHMTYPGLKPVPLATNHLSYAKAKDRVRRSTLRVALARRA